MMIDSQMGFPLWIRTGTCFLTGFICRSRGLLLLKSSSFVSYSNPFSLKAILTLAAKGLTSQSNKTIRSSAILNFANPMNGLF
uniref:Glutathione S-transferase 3 n=1 Tax=Rhizophora mucronata TaxID=61149 RepID=A0A2P2MM61_RHIMU